MDTIPPRPDGINHQTVTLPLIGQIDLLPLVGGDALPGKRRGIAVKEIPSLLATPLIGNDGTRNKRVLGLRRIFTPTLGPGIIPAIEPGCIHRPSPIILGTEELDEVALVARTPLDHQLEIAQYAREPGSRLLASLSGCNHFRDEGIEFGRNRCSQQHSRVDPNSGAQCRIKAHDPSGRRQKVRIGVLRAHPCLDGNASLANFEPSNRFPARDANLELHQIDSENFFGDSMLDLQPWVHLEKEKPLLTQQEFNGPDALVTHLPGQARRRLLQFSPGVGVEPGRRSLFEHFLVAPLNRTIATPQGNHFAVKIRCDLHFDMSPPGDQLLAKEISVPEGR